jgi:ectoine hydroxylase-related dioxygenase (phytanoyl-CoA dioxygenase family)
LNLVDDSVMSRVEADLSPLLEPDLTPKPDQANSKFLGLKTKRICGLIAKSKTSQELALNPLILECIGKGLDQFQLHVSQAICIGPGEDRQSLHRDDLVYPGFEHPLEKELVINVLWAVRDFTEEAGGTMAIPGSHKWNDLQEPRDEEAVATVMPRGSALIYFGSVFHGGGANRTKDKTRVAVAMTYSRNWLRQEENQYLVAPPSIAKNMPEELQRLIGYSVRESFLGWVDMQDPIDLIKRGELL